jgi:hypothetical protein
MSIQAYTACNFFILGWFLYVEHMVEWLIIMRWTRDRGVWGSIPGGTSHVWSLRQALNPHCLWSPIPAVMGTWWKLKSKIVWMAETASIALHSSQEDETVKVWVPIPRSNLGKTRWTLGDIWTINMHLYLFTFLLQCIQVSYKYVSSIFLVSCTFLVSS